MAKLHTPVEERVTDPETWHPRHRRRIREWAEARVLWRRGAPSYPTRAARNEQSVRRIPKAAVAAMKAAA